MIEPVDPNVYMALPYTRILKADDDGTFVASIQELKGCVAHGDTEMEALSNLRAIQLAWFEESIAEGLDIPLPLEEEALPSGKWLQRVSRSLHRDLIALAKREDVSLNQLVATALSDLVGARRSGDLQRSISAARGPSLPATLHFHGSYGTPASFGSWLFLGEPAVDVDATFLLNQVPSKGEQRIKEVRNHEAKAAHVQHQHQH